MFNPSMATSGRTPTGSRKKKTRTFSGCWTCRSRRIKCDERRPVCDRCSRARIACQGYGVRLNWTNAPSSSATTTDGRPTVSGNDKYAGSADNRAVAAFGGSWEYAQHTPPCSYPRFRSVQADELAVPSCQRDLLHHWVSFMCKNMVPVDLVDNPYRLVYLPFAFNGIHLPVTQSSSNLALFHGLCAASAENQLYLGVAKPGVTKLLAARHNRLALQHLQLAIDFQSPRDSDNVTAVLSAILFCILGDVVGGEGRNWRGHVQGALGCLADPSEIEVQAGSHMHLVLEQLLCLAVFGNVKTTYDIDALIAKLPGAISYMSQYHGVDKFILRSVFAINRYVAGSGSRSDTASSKLDLQRLELQASLHAPATVSPGIYLRREDAQAAMHYAHVYYYALLIYFQRCIYQSSPESVSGMVDRALCHLETAEEIAGASNGCILLWPCLVIAAECGSAYMKARALEWFKRKRRHGFASVDTGADILANYWKWRDENPDEASRTTWQEFVRGTEDDVVPI
ncbi:Fungal Zn binuclear cluster domain containing protein, partial [Metarhizium brunneum ARSEF 3297]